MHRLVNFARLLFFDSENIDQIRHFGVAQAFQIGKAGFDQGHRLLLGDRQRRRKGLRGMRYLLLDRSRARRFLLDVDFPARQATR